MFGSGVAWACLTPSSKSHLNWAQWPAESTTTKLSGVTSDLGESLIQTTTIATSSVPLKHDETWHLQLKKLCALWPAEPLDRRGKEIAEGPKQAVGDDQETIAVARHRCWQVVANAWEKPPPHLFDRTYSFPTQAAFDLADTSKSSTILMSSDFFHLMTGSWTPVLHSKAESLTLSSLSTSFIFPYGHLCLRWGQACGKSGRRQRGHLGPKLRSLPLLGGRQAGLSRRYSGMSWMPCNHQWSYAISVCL